MTMPQHALLVLILPLVSAAIIGLFLRRAGGLASIISTVAALGIAAIALILALHKERFPADDAPAFAIEWLKFGSFSLSLGIKFDDLAALMLTIVGVVGLCVHVFSLGYMHEDGARARYFGGLSIFMFSMIGIVLADNLFMMFVFWELVGFSSWNLINHYLYRQEAADAAKKAFIVNRVGDFGFLIGIIWCYAQFGTVNLAELEKLLGHGGPVVAAGIPLLLFCGAVGKSAQMPLHVWLPDAMEGPTPVSALIHAATMVAAGIYMLCRINILMVPDALQVIMWVGTATALYAALCAIVQNDIKKVLAYSTLSQLGYMVAAFGLGSVRMNHEDHFDLIPIGMGVAMFHLMTHAWFKALLFLGSGSVIHACHHEQDMFKMGGLWKKLPLTFITFTIGVVALIGVPYVAAGFYSKDAILLYAFRMNKAVFGVLAFTAILTAFYMVRQWKLIFLGTPRSENAGHAHEGGITLKLPLIVLSILALVGGCEWFFQDATGKAFDDVLNWIPVFPEDNHSEHFIILGTSIVVLAIGALLGWTLYQPAATDSLAQKAPGLYAALRGLWASFDRAYNYYVAKIQQRFAMVLNFLEQILLAGVVVRGLSGLVGLFGLGARALHVGNVNAYAYWFLLGVVALWAFATGWMTF